jgi:ABC-2 type transport system permease protein
VNAVSILWLRQLKRYFRSRARMIGSLGQPTLFLLALGFGLGPTFARAGGGDYVQFLAPGIVTMGILFTAVFSGIEIIWDRQFGFLKETLVAPVSRLEIVLGRTLGSATVALIQGSIVFLVCLAAGFRPAHPLLLPVALLFMVLIAIMCTAIGTAVGSVLQDMQGFQLIMNFIVLPLFFFSSALFPVPELSAAMRLAVRLNPLSYGVDGLRGALNGGFASGSRPTSWSSAASPRSCSRSAPTCSRRSRCSGRWRCRPPPARKPRVRCERCGRWPLSTN